MVKSTSGYSVLRTPRSLSSSFLGTTMRSTATDVRNVPEPFTLVIPNPILPICSTMASGSFGLKILTITDPIAILVSSAIPRTVPMP